MIEEKIVLTLETKGADDVNAAIGALDKLEQRARRVAVPPALKALTADVEAVRTAMTEARKFAAAAPIKPPPVPRPDGLRPDLAPKPIPDPLTRPASGRRLAGVHPSLFPAVVAAFSPSIIGPFLNKHDPLLKGAADRYFLKTAAENRRLNEYILGTTPGFLYGTTRAGIDRLRYPNGLPLEPPPKISKDAEAWRNLKARTPAHPWAHYSDSYRETKELRKLMDANPRGPDPRAEGLFRTQKRNARWRREPPAARRPRGTPERPAIPKGTGDVLRRERGDVPPLPPRARASAPALHNAKLFSAAATPLASLKPLSDLVNDIRRHAEHAAPLAALAKKMTPEAVAATPAPLQTLTEPEQLPPRAPKLPEPLSPDFIRALAALREAAPPLTPIAYAEHRTGLIPPNPQPPRPDLPTPRPDASPRNGNTYHITIHKIADKIEAGTVDEKSLMKLLSHIVETELPT
jgi:hypothetical protein